MQKKHSTLTGKLISVELYPNVDGFMTNKFTPALRIGINPLKCSLVAAQKKVKLVVFLLSS